tara:strand:- start:1104 stop:1247 length:144 start_codon:yes stop_codon:yes gene_type:complete
MKDEIKKQLTKHLNNIYYLIAQNNKENKEVKKILFNIDKLEKKINKL